MTTVEKYKTIKKYENTYPQIPNMPKSILEKYQNIDLIALRKPSDRAYMISNEN